MNCMQGEEEEEEEQRKEGKGDYVKLGGRDIIWAKGDFKTTDSHPQL